MLTAAGHKPADLKVPAPRVLDLPDELAERIREELEALGGDRDAVARLRAGSWDLAFDDGLLVELDKDLHFNRHRRQTLQAPRRGRRCPVPKFRPHAGPLDMPYHARTDDLSALTVTLRRPTRLRHEARAR
jgi:hypothetical protein